MLMFVPERIFLPLSNRKGRLILLLQSSSLFLSSFSPFFVTNRLKADAYGPFPHTTFIKKMAQGFAAQNAGILSGQDRFCKSA